MTVHLYCKYEKCIVLDSLPEEQYLISVDLPTPTGRQSFLSFQCFNCGKWYQHRTTLKRHLKLECGKEPQFHCSLCPYKAKQKIHLSKHTAAKHRIVI